MTFRRRLLPVLLIALALVSRTFEAQAVPARPGSFTMKQPDGSVITVTLHGDEHFNYYVTTDGYPLLPDDDGWLCYVKPEGRSVGVTTMRAHDPSRRLAEEKAFAGTIDADAAMTGLKRLRTELSARKVQARAGFSDMMSDYPTIGSPKALILLVEFSDRKFTTENAQAEFEKLMNEPGYSYNGGTGSALDYFVENSNGKFTPEFVVCGPVTLPNNMAYYGAPTANMYDARPGEMIADGCRILDETTDIDFSQFDNDGDGIVDNVFVFYAGYGQNSGADVNTIWPHAANILTYYNIRLELDGVQIGNYACTNELQGNEGTVRTGIGTFCHEFSHVLGLPDLYPTDNSGGFTPGPFELMDTGPYNNNGNTPPYMSAFDRMSLRWLNPRELTGPETVTLHDITTDEAFLIKTIRDNEYYLFENRQQRRWDTFIPGHGMLVWHIDYDATVWKDNKVNNTPAHQRVDLVEADNVPTNATRSGDPFPGVNNVTQLTDESTPAMSTWTSVRIGLPVTDILEQDGVISFKVAGGGDRIESVTALDATDVTPTSFRAEWEGRVTINKYEVDVCLNGEVVPMRTVTKETRSTADCYVDVEGLQPSTGYYYVVRAVDGNMRSSNSNRIDVRTADPTFDMLKVTAAEPVDVGETSFTACWQPLEGAEAYELSVYTKEYVEPEHDVVDFADDLTLPEGWYTTCTTTSGVAGTFGSARPSLRMISDREMIGTPTYDADISGLTFWYCGSKDAAGSLLVEQLTAGGEWTELASLDVQQGGQTALFGSSSVQGIARGCRSIRMTFLCTAGSLYIDDIDVAYGAAATPVYVDGYERRDVGAVTSFGVTGLTSGADYFYTVTARKGELRSIESDETAVLTGSSDGITAVSGSLLGISLQDDAITVTNTSSAPAPVEVCTLGGTLLYRGTVAPSSAVTIPAGRTGICIVKAGTEAMKVLR